MGVGVGLGVGDGLPIEFGGSKNYPEPKPRFWLLK
jgi:hypothetical protein